MEIDKHMDNNSHRTFTKNFIPLLDKSDHLAVYTSFHRSVGNKRLHTIFLPFIVLSVLTVLAYLNVHSSFHMLHLGTIVALLVVLVIASIDLPGAICSLFWIIPLCVFSGYLADSFPIFIVIPSAILTFLIGYYATVVVGHFKMEPLLQIKNMREDSNYYFRKGYVFSQGLHPDLGLADALVQFCIAPLAFTHEGLYQLGMRKKIEQKIIIKRSDFIQRLANDQQPLVVI
jgi:uncharacterized membrane protein YGL010W